MGLRDRWRWANERPPGWSIESYSEDLHNYSFKSDKCPGFIHVKDGCLLWAFGDGSVFNGTTGEIYDATGIGYIVFA